MNNPKLHDPCIYKRAYKSEHTANNAAFAMFKRDDQRKYPQGVAYRCPYCGRWHIRPINQP